MKLGTYGNTNLALMPILSILCVRKNSNVVLVQMTFDHVKLNILETLFTTAANVTCANCLILIVAYEMAFFPCTSHQFFP